MKSETCAERVKPAWESRHADMSLLFFGPDLSQVRLGDDGTLDTILILENGDEIRFGDSASYRNEDGALDIASFFQDHEVEIREFCYERWSEYGLAFDYVPAGTFDDQPNGYHRFQISWGGPSEEIRFYSGADGGLHRAEFWFMDWFDGASIDVTSNEFIQAYWRDMVDCGVVHHDLD